MAIDRWGDQYSIRCDDCGWVSPIKHRYINAIVSDHATRGWTRSGQGDAKTDHCQKCAQAKAGKDPA